MAPNGPRATAGVSDKGVPNKGIDIGGGVEESCAYKDQLDYSNTMYRKHCIKEKEINYCAIMFAVYMVKDDASSGYGHKNDWEFGLMWTTRKPGNPEQLTHASYSAHGDVMTKTIESLYPKDKQNIMNYFQRKAVFMNYYKDGPSTHAMRLPNETEVAKRKIQNPTGEWVIPLLVDWGKLVPYVREKFISHNYGSADVPMTPRNFYSNIKKGIDGTRYPSALYSNLPSSDFEGVWKVVNTTQPVEITLSRLKEGKGNANASSGEVGTWKEMADKAKWAVITWKDTGTIEKTKIAKEDDQYTKSDYCIHEKLEKEPTTKSVTVVPPERCPAPSGQSICQ